MDATNLTFWLTQLQEIRKEEEKNHAQLQRQSRY